MIKDFMLRFSLLAAVLFFLAGTASADKKQNNMGCHAMTVNTEIVADMDKPCTEEADSTEVQEQRTSPREELVFYYHTDHLGSTNLVTDRGRSICHAAEYLPYGEVFLEIKGSYDHLGTPFKFNGKEMDPETGMLYYGARYYMPKYYQWPTCDPMQLKYPHVSSYAYCMGNPVKLIDLFGLAPGDFFRTVNAAAIDFGLFYNDNSIREGREYGSSIYVVYNRKGEKGYSYSIPNVGKKDVVTVSNPPMGHIPIAVIHTHGRYQDDYHNNEFSGLRDSHDRFFDINYRRHVNGSHDIGNSNNLNIISYLVTPNGSLQKYDPSSSKITVISNDMPSDVEDPNRLNKVNSIVETNPIGSSDYLRIWRNIITDNYE